MTVQAEPVLVAGLIEVCRATIAANTDHLCALDRAIGDGDHGTNMRRGCEAVSAEGETLSGLPLPDAMIWFLVRPVGIFAETVTDRVAIRRPDIKSPKLAMAEL